MSALLNQEIDMEELFEYNENEEDQEFSSHGMSFFFLINQVANKHFKSSFTQTLKKKKIKLIPILTLIRLKVSKNILKKERRWISRFY